ncbi:PREDICTED: beta-1,3-galactosyltransferase GALT1-like isoform X2 [Lupinus angustifolius]|uniref:beta-1,3-galactosyltransferase GALT1-like isoform X2 n=1 Tax=Lupinus angustifolius TaxID=3871 RepID=UPI00092EF3A6|nr:PREDICTED: beta-1,3-galactosyltransferase GALT1-like isoform X2 [Lupinus angustifolius]
MNKLYGGLLITSSFMLFMLMILRYGVMKYPVDGGYLTIPVTINGTNPLEWINSVIPPAVQNPDSDSQVISTDILISSLFSGSSFTKEEQQALQTWNRLKHLLDHAQGLPNAAGAIKEAASAWNNLVSSIEEQRQGHANDSSRTNEKQCPHFLNKMDSTEVGNSSYKLQVPCGLTQGSSITVIGVPNGLLGDFRIDLTGELLPGEPDPPIILHYNIRLHGDKITEDPVIVQNSWTVAHDWGGEERCPSLNPEKVTKVDELEQCSKIVGKNISQHYVASMRSHTSRRFSEAEEQSENNKYFPFKQGYPFVATLRVGSEGIQMTVDGKHITSFAFRETLEPWLVSEIKISGDLKLISVLASGLPTSEDSEHIIDLESLKASSISAQTSLDLFIGVFSTANNFKRRMAVRRTWMQYNAIRSNTTAVRFFVGLHKSQIVNEELWKEAQTYRDIQLMPFVDYYSLITWKSLAICIFGMEVVSAKFVMKTDDDAFVRVDEVLGSLKKINVAHGLLYGLINSDSEPHRNSDSKWYISPQFHLT